MIYVIRMNYTNCRTEHIIKAIECQEEMIFFWSSIPIRSQPGRYIKQLELCVTKNVSQEVQMIVIINYRAIFKA